MRGPTIRSALAVALAAAVPSALPASAPAAFEPQNYGLSSTAFTVSSAQAGAHADLSTSFTLATHGENESYALTRDISVALPPGFVGNPQRIPQCTSEQFGNEPEESACPIDSQVGVAEVTIGGALANTFTEPLYNMEPPKGGDVVARLGFYAVLYPVMISITVDPVTYGLVATLEGAPAAAEVIGSTVTTWGVPPASEHDPFRLTPAEAEHSAGPPGGRPSTLTEAPFMTNPTSCEPAGDAVFIATSYQRPDLPSTLPAAAPQMSGCSRITFSPSLSLGLTDPEAAAPTGIAADLKMTQDETPAGRGTSTLKSARVVLPAGLAINPAAGDSLAACSAEEVEFEKNLAARCSGASKVGSAVIDVPALQHPLKGSVYLRTPEPGHLFRFWLVSEELGVDLKLPAEIEADPVTGQLTAVFPGVPALGGNPQVPVSDVKLNVFGGPRAPLATPAQCGGSMAHYEFVPWSGGPAVTGATEMGVTSGCGKGGFAPAFSAGTVNPAAGGYSPFVMRLSRSDGEGNPQSLEVTLPKGLLAKLSAVALCPAASAASGTCPAASQIGTVEVAAGVGGAPLWVPQPGKAPTAVYLAGPYEGAPFSLVIKVPAQAGPFDLGTVVTRAAIHVDPHTAQVSVVSDPLPQILEGVPIDYRTIYVDIDRPEFTLNPTSCDAMSVTAAVTSSAGQVANDSQGFQASDCSRLAFTPGFKASTTGKTSRIDGAGLNVSLTYPKNALGNDANIRSVKVSLPRQLPSRLSTLQKACLAVVFDANPAACPADSRVGTARARTPILSTELQGPAYFVSHGGAKFPELIIVLQGEGITVDLNGETFISARGITSSTFSTVPDVPVEAFELNLPQGPSSALGANHNLCALTRTVTRRKKVATSKNGHRHTTVRSVKKTVPAGLTMPTIFTAQNGAVLKQNTPIAVAGCPRKVVNVKRHKRRR